MLSSSSTASEMDRLAMPAACANTSCNAYTKPDGHPTCARSSQSSRNSRRGCGLHHDTWTPSCGCHAARWKNWVKVGVIGREDNQNRDDPRSCSKLFSGSSGDLVRRLYLASWRARWGSGIVATRRSTHYNKYCKDGLRRNRSSIVSTWRTPRTPISNLSRATHQ